MAQVEVLVKSKESGDNRVITYKSYLDVSDKFELIGQSDSEGNLIPGDPNLNPRHQRTQASASVVVHAAEGGDQEPVIDDVPREIVQKEPEIEEVQQSPELPKVKRKYTKKQPA